MSKRYVSPYARIKPSDWQKKTEELFAAYPLNCKQIVEPILATWKSIFKSKIGHRGFQIGKDIFPTPQIMAFLLHELIPLEFAACYPKQWRRDNTADEKDLIYIPDGQFSLEIKCSSSPKKIFGNRSYAQALSQIKKSKNGYYLAINFQKFSGDRRELQQPKIIRIRFGWLDHTDWKGQKSETGQQASLKPESEKGKLLVLYEYS